MPSKDCLRLDEDDGAAPTREQTGREQETKSVDRGESWTGHSSAEHHDLVAKQGVFHEEFAPAANGVEGTSANGARFLQTAEAQFRTRLRIQCRRSTIQAVQHGPAMSQSPRPRATTAGGWAG